MGAEKKNDLRGSTEVRVIPAMRGANKGARPSPVSPAFEKAVSHEKALRKSVTQRKGDESVRVGQSHESVQDKPFTTY